MNHEETIFEQALGIASADARNDYLRKACEGDMVLFERLQALLLAHDRAGKFLEHEKADGPQHPAAEPAGGSTLALNLPLTEKPGDHIGRYKLLQKIGEGGCGVVYMAEQEEPVRRRVALKIIKLGMDTRQVIARFEAERQALALMDHPNIAKVLDAGATETGRPYFVMELVRGIKITDYCDEKKLSTEQRLELFMQVCRAVQHAHQKGIVHRDLKPSNILVSFNDGIEVPKIIDFGIAKATSGEPLTDKTVFTAFEQFIGTPAYMSPEQALVSSLDVDTRTDIYALGVLLYELLTGRTPFDPKELLQGGIDAMRRTICEKEPERPSTRLSTMPGEELNTTAQRRGLDAPKLVSQLRGDLDWIVMKCLEKDRARRYETANGLAADIHRHLKNEPVVACPPGNFYRFQKLVRRNKLAFAGAGAVSCALVIGLALALWQSVEKTSAYHRALAAEKAAQTEAHKSDQVARILKEMLRGVTPESAGGRDTSLLRELLDRTADRIGTDLRNEPDVEMQVLNILTEVYADLGFQDQAKQMGRRSLELARSSLPSSAVAKALALYGRNGTTDAVEKEKYYREALAMERKLHGNQGKELGYILQVFGYFLSGQGKTVEVEQILQERLRVETQLHGEESPEVAEVYDNLANFRREQGRLTEAEPLYRKAVDMYKKTLGEMNSVVADTINDMIPALVALGKTDEVKALKNEVLEIRQKSKTDAQPGTARIVQALAAQGQWQEAERIAREDVDTRKKSYRTLQLGSALDLLGEILRAREKFADAETIFRQSLALTEKEHSYRGIRANNLAIVLQRQDKLPEAEIMFKEALAADAQNPQHFQNLAVLLGNLANVLLAQGKLAEANQKYAESQAAQRKAWAKSAESGNARDLNALAWTLATSTDASLRDGKKAVELAKKSVAASNRKDPMTLDTLAAAYAEDAQFQKAQQVQQEAIGLLQDEEQKKDYRRRLKFYTANLPFRDFEYDRLQQQAQTLRQHRKLPEAEQMLREALDEIKEGSIEEADPQVLFAFNALGNVLAEQGKSAEAEIPYRRTLKLAEALNGSEHQQNTVFLLNLALTLRNEKKLTEAEGYLRRALEILRKQPINEHPEEVVQTVRYLTRVLADQDKREQGQQILDETLKLMKNTLELNHPTTLTAMNDLAEAYQEAGKVDQALPLFEETLNLRKLKLGPDHTDTLDSMNNLARTYMYAGRLDQARSLFEAALKLSETKLGPYRLTTLNSMDGLANCFAAMKNYAEADTWRQKWSERIRERDGPESLGNAGALASLGQSFLKRQQWAKAEPLLRESLAIREKIRPDDWGTFSTKSMLGGALLGQRKFDEARPMVVAAYNGLKERETKALSNNGIRDALTDALDRLEVMYDSCQDRPEAAEWKGEIERVRRVKDNGAIRHWLILAPIALASGQWGVQALEQEQLVGEANLRPQAGDKVSIGGRELIWREHSLRDYAIDFNRLLGEETPGSVAYAVCHIKMPAHRKGLVIKVGSDDEARVYLNGQKIYEAKRARPLMLDEDTISDVELKAGVNILVFKVVNDGGNWRGSLRFADGDDQPIQGIQVSIQPD